MNQTKPKVLVICETNFIYSNGFRRDRNCVYLLDLSKTGKIELAIPEFSFYEIKHAVNQTFKKRSGELYRVYSFLNELIKSEQHASTFSEVKEKFKQLELDSPSEKLGVLNSAEEIKSLCIPIPYDLNIFYKAHLRSIADMPPHKDNDRRIYESILEFVNREKNSYDLKLFYTADREDFDHPELHEELGKIEVELYFSSGKVLERLREYYAR
ncbi:MAG: PIN domain-containing protein [Methanosarcinales archaeon]